MLLSLRTQDPASARRLLEAAPAEVADSPIVMMAAAQVAARLPAEESAASFTAIESRATALKKEESGQLLANLGSIRRATGNLVEAERLWQAALAVRPDDIQIITALQELACDSGDVARATAAAAEIAKLAGQNSPQGKVASAAAILLAVRRQQAQRLEDAAPAQRRTAAATTPQEKEQLTSAYNLLVEAENDRPNWARIQRLLADIAILRGDLPEAVERLQRATRQGVADPNLLRQLLSLLYATNRLDEAQQTLTRLGPDGASGLERLSAEIDLGTGRFEDAVTAAERSLDSGEQANAADLLWFGQVLAQGRKGRAGRRGAAAGRRCRPAAAGELARPFVGAAVGGAAAGGGANPREGGRGTRAAAAGGGSGPGK